MCIFEDNTHVFHNFAVALRPLRVLQLMNLTDSRLAQAGNERLELAMLSFFEQFRKIYIGDQVQKSSKVNTKRHGRRGRRAVSVSVACVSGVKWAPSWRR